MLCLWIWFADYTLQLIQFGLERSSIPVLGGADGHGHQQRDDNRNRVEGQLPIVRKTEEGPAATQIVHTVALRTTVERRTAAPAR